MKTEWGKISPDLWHRFKIVAVKNGQKLYEAQEIAIKLYLKKEAKK
jgi:hypothetical protein